jgi:subtilisin-like proprotein convertase family protein
MKIRSTSLHALRSCLTAAALFMGVAQAQAADTRVLEKPAATQMDLLPAELVDARFAPALDYDKIAAEDELIAVSGEAPRYAIPNEVHLTPDMDGTWETVADKDGSERRVWRLRLVCDNAVSMNLGFTQFWLPKTATLFVHDGSLASIVRPFTAADNAEHGQLWTPPVPGSEIVVELTVDKAFEKDVRLVVGSVNAGYRRFMEIAKEVVSADKSGSCNVDVVCSQGDGWRDEIPSVGVISTGGSRFCTGAMINNVRQDLTPYFLTAYHCGVTASNAASLVVYWNYENSTCRTPGSTASGSAGNGQLTQFTTGSTFRAGYSASDMTLVQLSSQPNQAWKVSYSGFDARNVETTSNIAIHHPNTDEKRISFDNQASTTTSYNTSTSPGDGTHIRVGNWELGTTEPGSSGSPLYNQNHQIVGQLHGGSASCTSITNDFYGRLSVSWNGGGTAATSLKTWLDPDNTGTLVVNTRTTGGLSVSPTSPVTALGNVGGPFSGLPVTHNLTNGSSSSVNYTVSLSADIGLQLNGGAGPVSGSLAAGGSGSVIVSAGAGLLSRPAGIYTATVVFTDTTNNITTNVPYTVEVGQTGISVTPATSLTGGGAVGGPFTTTQQYVITSTKTAPVNVTVSANAGWLTIDGSAAPLSFTLNTQGASRTVTVAFGGSASSLAAGVYTGQVSITNASGGSGGTTRSATLEVGRQVYAATDCPKPVADNTTVYSYITVADDVCIGDIDVAVDITHTYIGDLIVELTSPAGTVISLHNRTGSGADNIVTTYDDEGGGTLPAASLSGLDGERTAGQWRLRVSDAANTDTGTLNGWSLRIAQSAGGCQPRQVIYSENLDASPGWTTTGQWAWGTPTGGGASNGAKDPTSGATGTKVYGYNLSGDYTNSMPAYTLTSTAFDCTGLTGTKLSFKRWLNVESSSYDKASVAVSNNGTTWTTIWQNGATLKETAWSSVSYDISAVADNQPTVYLRWTIGPTDTSVVYGGWNIDDIEISAIPAANPCPSDLDGDGETTAGDISFLLLSAGPCAGCPEDLDGDGEVGASDVSFMLLSFGPCM